MASRYSSSNLCSVNLVGNVRILVKAKHLWYILVSHSTITAYVVLCTHLDISYICPMNIEHIVFDRFTMSKGRADVKKW